MPERVGVAVRGAGLEAVRRALCRLLLGGRSRTEEEIHRDAYERWVQGAYKRLYPPPVCSHRIARLFLARQPPQPSQQPQPEIVPALTAPHCCAAPARMRCRLLGDLKRSGLSVGSVDHTPYAAVCLVGGCYEALGWAVDCKRFHTITKSVTNGCEALVRVDWNDVYNHSWCTVWPVRFVG